MGAGSMAGGRLAGEDFSDKKQWGKNDN